MFKTILSHIIETDEEAAATPAKVSAPTLARGVTTQGVAAGPNQAMVDMITKATMSRNTPFTALVIASEALIDFIPDPTTRLKAAQKTAGAGRSAKDAADAVAIHLNDVDNEVLKFNASFKGKFTAEVSSLTQRADGLESDADAKVKQIEALNAQIAQLTEAINTQRTQAGELRANAATAEAGLRQTEAEFAAAADQVRNQLNAQKAAILSTI